MTRVYLIRHCTTDNNVKGIFQGSIDIELGEQGLAQAKCLARRFSDAALKAVYTSPLKRARQTAEAICDHYRFAPVVQDRLRELHGGLLEGHTSAYNNEKFPECMQCLSVRPALFRAPQGESCREVYDRMLAVMDEIVGRHPGEEIAVVSHGLAIQLYLGYVNGVVFEELERYIVGNGAVNVLDYDRELHVRAERINDEEHIPEELRFSLARNFMREVAPETGAVPDDIRR